MNYERRKVRESFDQEHFERVLAARERLLDLEDQIVCNVPLDTEDYEDSWFERHAFTLVLVCLILVLSTAFAVAALLS